MNYPTLSTAEALKQAMVGKEQRYLIDNLPLEGTPVKTRFDILQGDYVYLNFVYEHLVVKSRTDSHGLSYDYLEWERVSEGDENAVAEDLTLAGLAPLDGASCQFESEYFVGLDETTCVPSAVPLLAEGCYYPKGVSNEGGAIRYHLSAVPAEGKAIFLADVGGGKLTVVPADGERNVIVVDGDLDDYRYYVTEGTTGPMTLLMLFVLLPGCAVCLFLFLRSVVRAVRKR